MSKQVLSQEFVQASLGQALPKIHGCIHGGYRAYRRMLDLNPIAATAFNSSVAATVIHSLICDAARNAFTDDRAIEVSDAPGFFAITHAAGFNLRFKKFDIDNTASYNRTRQSLLLASQHTQGLFPWAPEAVIVAGRPFMVAGYRLNEIETQIQDTLITCPASPSRNHWAFSLEQFAEKRENTAKLERANTDEETQTRIRHKMVPVQLWINEGH